MNGKTTAEGAGEVRINQAREQKIVSWSCAKTNVRWLRWNRF